MIGRLPNYAAALAAFAIAAAPATLAIAQTAEDEILAAMARWSEVYMTATDAAEMQALYHEDAVFFGTGGRAPMVGAAEFGPYFQGQFDNYTSRAHEFVDPVIRIFGDAATSTGLYFFSVTPVAGGAPVEVLYRYTFAYVLTDEGWLIVQHHSSQLP
jgi:hypothetical protein